MGVVHGVEGKQTAAVGKLQSADRYSGVVVADLARVGQIDGEGIFYIRYPSADACSCYRDRPGIGVAVVGSENVCAVGADELVEGVADVACPADIRHRIIRLRNSHAALIDGIAHVCLMVQTVGRLIHLMAGVDKERSSALRHAQRARVERYVGVGSVNGCRTHAFPVLCVLDDTHYLDGIALIEIRLSEHQIIEARAAEEAAEDIQLTRGTYGAQQAFAVRGIVFDDQLAARVFDPLQGTVRLLGQVGIDRRCADCVVMVADVGACFSLEGDGLVLPRPGRIIRLCGKSRVRHHEQAREHKAGEQNGNHPLLHKKASFC